VDAVLKTVDATATPPALTVLDELSERHIRQLHGLYQGEWWSRDRTLEEARSCVGESQLCIALVDAGDNLVGFARVLSDFTFKAFIFDVIVAPGMRGAGLGDRLMQLVTGHDKLRQVRHMELYCLPEMMPFYERHGFSGEPGPIKLMRRDNA
jgi:GNAT superfamily N-acetyltransferase